MRIEEKKNKDKPPQRNPLLSQSLKDGRLGHRASQRLCQTWSCTEMDQGTKDQHSVSDSLLFPSCERDEKRQSNLKLVENVLLSLCDDDLRRNGAGKGIVDDTTTKTERLVGSISGTWIDTQSRQEEGIERQEGRKARRKEGRRRLTLGVNDEGTHEGLFEVIVEALVKEVGDADVVIVKEPDRVIESGEEPNEREDETHEVAREMCRRCVCDETVDKEVGPCAMVDEIESAFVGLELSPDRLELDAKEEGVCVRVVKVGASIGRLHLPLEPRDREHDEDGEGRGDDAKVKDAEGKDRELEQSGKHTHVLVLVGTAALVVVAVAVAAPLRGLWGCLDVGTTKEKENPSHHLILFLLSLRHPHPSHPSHPSHPPLKVCQSFSSSHSLSSPHPSDTKPQDNPRNNEMWLFTAILAALLILLLWLWSKWEDKPKDNKSFEKAFVEAHEKIQLEEVQEKADRLAKEEADRLAKEEADRLAKEEADRLAQEEADRLAKEEADRLAKEESERIVNDEPVRVPVEEEWRFEEGDLWNVWKRYEGFKPHSLRHVVVDAGSTNVRAGFSDVATPQYCFPSYVGADVVSSKNEECLVGTEMFHRSIVCSFSFPLLSSHTHTQYKRISPLARRRSRKGWSAFPSRKETSQTLSSTSRSSNSEFFPSFLPQVESRADRNGKQTQCDRKVSIRHDRNLDPIRQRSKKGKQKLLSLLNSLSLS